jgi:hypothetical protein
MFSHKTGSDTSTELDHDRTYDADGTAISGTTLQDVESTATDDSVIDGAVVDDTDEFGAGQHSLNEDGYGDGDSDDAVTDDDATLSTTDTTDADDDADDDEEMSADDVAILTATDDSVDDTDDDTDPDADDVAAIVSEDADTTATGDVDMAASGQMATDLESADPESTNSNVTNADTTDVDESDGEVANAELINVDATDTDASDMDASDADLTDMDEAGMDEAGMDEVDANAGDSSSADSISADVDSDDVDSADVDSADVNLDDAEEEDSASEPTLAADDDTSDVDGIADIDAGDGDVVDVEVLDGEVVEIDAASGTWTAEDDLAALIVVEPADQDVSATPDDDLVADQGGAPVTSGAMRPGDAPVPDAVPAMADASAIHTRWREAQLGFIDDPRSSALAAGGIAAETVEAHIAALRERLAALDAWQQDASPDTEVLRASMQGYRALVTSMVGEA